jgi:hypothetical protein
MDSAVSHRRPINLQGTDVKNPVKCNFLNYINSSGCEENFLQKERLVSYSKKTNWG